MLDVFKYFMGTNPKVSIIEGEGEYSDLSYISIYVLSPLGLE